MCSICRSLYSRAVIYWIQLSSYCARFCYRNFDSENSSLAWRPCWKFCRNYPFNLLIRIRCQMLSEKDDRSSIRRFVYSIVKYLSNSRTVPFWCSAPFQRQQLWLLDKEEEDGRSDRVHQHQSRCVDEDSGGSGTFDRPQRTVKLSTRTLKPTWSSGNWNRGKPASSYNNGLTSSWASSWEWDCRFANLTED